MLGALAGGRALPGVSCLPQPCLGPGGLAAHLAWASGARSVPRGQKFSTITPLPYSSKTCEYCLDFIIISSVTFKSLHVSVKN